MVTFWLFEIITFQVKITVATFWPTFGKIRTSSHTAKRAFN